jgi:hypothetical protein
VLLKIQFFSILHCVDRYIVPEVSEVLVPLFSESGIPRRLLEPKETSRTLYPTTWHTTSEFLPTYYSAPVISDYMTSAVVVK